MTYAADTFYIGRLLKENQSSLQKTAGIMDTVSTLAEGVVGYVKSLWDEKKPLGSVMSFIGPGILFRLGFPWIAVAVEVAGALGFDWIGFWDTMKTNVLDLAKSLWGNKEKISQEELHEKTTKITNDALNQHVSDKVDEEKLAELAKTSAKYSMQASGAVSMSRIIKEAGIFGAAAKSRGLLKGIFSKIVPWVITTALVSLGLAVGGGVVKQIVPTSEKKDDDAASTERDPIHNLTVSPNVSSDMTEYNNNGPGSVWLEEGNINNIKQYLSSWISNVFPQLQSERGQIENCPGFIQVENMFRNRNKLATNLKIYSVPKPFEKKIDIVSYIISQYLKTRGTNAPQKQ
jgi:hypothetical protein